MPDKLHARFHRVTDLFVTGRELILQDGPEPVLLWINKLNSFQRGDAQRDGAAVQARRMAALDDDSDEIAAALTRLHSLEGHEVIAFLVNQHDDEDFLLAIDDVRADESWNDRLAIIDRATALEAEGSPPDEAEREAVLKVNQEYLAAVDEHRLRRVEDRKDAFADVPIEELRKQWLDAFRRRLGMSVFMQEYEKTQVFFATRDCEAKDRGNGTFDHTACTHARLLPSRAAVAEMPEELFDRIRNVLTDMTIPPATAGNSAAPRTSSAPSEPPSSAEDSPPSTPTET